MNAYTWQFKLGIFLIVLSSLLYASLIVIPFLDISVSIKLGITPIIVIVGESIFWIGGVLVGKEFIVKYKKHLNPLNWIRKNKSCENNNDKDENSV
jgi:hypothetical protein